mmetsp:Transcript_1359/g.3413  ORF Transcript_1359/g.3413 Transcript_1359/m.3413 type:complete len:340 (-) Transcript_1359:898-1917(-)
MKSRARKVHGDGSPYISKDESRARLHIEVCDLHELLQAVNGWLGRSHTHVARPVLAIRHQSVMLHIMIVCQIDIVGIAAHMASVSRNFHPRHTTELVDEVLEGATRERCRALKYRIHKIEGDGIVNEHGIRLIDHTLVHLFLQMNVYVVAHLRRGNTFLVGIVGIAPIRRLRRRLFLGPTRGPFPGLDLLPFVPRHALPHLVQPVDLRQHPEDMLPRHAEELPVVPAEAQQGLHALDVTIREEVARSQKGEVVQGSDIRVPRSVIPAERCDAYRQLKAVERHLDGQVGVVHSVIHLFVGRNGGEHTIGSVCALNGSGEDRQRWSPSDVKHGRDILVPQP